MVKLAKRKPKVLMLFAFYTFIHVSCYAQLIKPVLAISSGYVKAFSNSEIQSGSFDIFHSKINYGLAITNNFDLSDHCFIKTGLRYNTFRLKVRALNMSKYLLSKPPPFTWIQNHESIILPIAIGKYLNLKNNTTGEIFLGYSIGIFNNTASILEYNNGITIDINSMDIIVPKYVFPPPSEGSNFFHTVDLGFNFQPFSRNTKWSLGLLVSAQLNKTFKNSFIAEMNNITQNEKNSYHLKLNQQYFLSTVVLGYSFIKTKRRTLNMNPLGK